MSSDTVISVNDVAKAYRIWNDPGARLKSPLIDTCGRLFPRGSEFRRKCEAKAAAYYRDFYALKGISFQVGRGESIGIIGRNGSGKSTLLQILAGTLQPTTGSAEVRGRVAALLELGSGFNPEFTGRENVYLNAAVLGLTRAETDARFDNIVAFADIGNFLDQPVKTYSSGMLVRLAFACAVSVEPDILIVDEALSVGDIFFQQKCFERIREILKRGTTFILVSHDLAAVQNLCEKAILLSHGELAHQGLPEDCVSRYHSSPRATVGLSPVTTSTTDQTSSRFQKAIELFDQANIMAESQDRFGNRDLEIRGVSIRRPDGTISREVVMMESLCIHVWLRANRPIGLPACGIHLFDRMNNLISAAGTEQLGNRIPPLKSGEDVVAIFKVQFSIQPGIYTFNVTVGESDPINPNIATFTDVCSGMGTISIAAPLEGTWPFYGMAQIPIHIDLIHGTPV